MFYSQRPMTFVRRSLALTAIFGASVALASAQTSSPANGTHDQASTTLNLHLPPVETSDLFSSSATTNEEPTLVASNDRFAPPVNAMQYNGGRRYGRPRYRGGNSNQDGSKKYEFYIGGGFQQPVGNTYHYYSPSWGFQVGAGRNFNQNVGVNVEFDYDHFGLNGRTLSQQSVVYFNDSNPSDSGLDANMHDWSISLDPVYNIPAREGLGAYLIGGVGFYHKVTNFTLPSTGQYCDYYYGCYFYQANVNADHYSSNAPGFNGGIGFTYKLSRFSGERLYGEIRYIVTLNQQRQGLSYSNLAQYGGDGSTYNGNNYFPQQPHHLPAGEVRHPLLTHESTVQERSPLRRAFLFTVPRNGSTEYYESN
jgi:hypothetical protein